MEYLMTYGWAILVVLIVGIVLWKTGLFGTSATGASGFTKITPAEWKFNHDTTGNSTVVWRNVAGRTLRNVVVSYSGDCTNSSVSLGTIGPGKQLTSNFVCNPSCTQGGSAKVNVGITYTSLGIHHTENGTIYANCE